MRLHRRAYLARGLSVATVAAVLALAATGDAEAQRRGGFGFSGAKMNMGAQRPMMMRSTAAPRVTATKMVNPKYGPKWGSKVGSKAAATNPGQGRRPQAAEGPRGRREAAGARRRPSAALAWPLSAPRLGAAGCDRHWRGDRHRCRDRHRRRCAAAARRARRSADLARSGRRHQYSAAERKPLRAERSGARVRRQSPAAGNRSRWRSATGSRGSTR